MLGLILLALTPTRIDAAEATDTQPQIERTRYTFVYLGDFASADPNASLGKEGSGSSFGAGYGRFFHRYLAVELEATMSSSDYVQPTGSRGEGEDFVLRVTTAAMMANLKAIGTFGRVSPFVSIGLGFGVSDLTLDAGRGLYYEEPLEEKLSLVAQSTIGADFRITRRSYLGLELRKLDPFDDLRWAGVRIKPGGESIVLAYKYSF
jgi:outer membrane protein W